MNKEISSRINRIAKVVFKGEDKLSPNKLINRLNQQSENMKSISIIILDALEIKEPAKLNLPLTFPELSWLRKNPKNRISATEVMSKMHKYVSLGASLESLETEEGIVVPKVMRLYPTMLIPLIERRRSMTISVKEMSISIMIPVVCHELTHVNQKVLGEFDETDQKRVDINAEAISKVGNNPDKVRDYVLNTPEGKITYYESSNELETHALQVAVSDYLGVNVKAIREIYSDTKFKRSQEFQDAIKKFEKLLRDNL